MVWRLHDTTTARPRELRIVDETLRDGLQSASAIDPPLDAKLRLLHAMNDLGIDVVSIGLPASGPRAEDTAVRLAREIAASRLRLRPTAAARTTEKDVIAVARVAEKAGIPIEVYSFIGTSPIRRFVEGWDLDFVLSHIREACRASANAGLPLCLVTEDTTRTPPEALERIYAAAVDAGATRLCLCDTVGHVDPHGTRALVEFVRGTLDRLGAHDVGIDWHGHDDRGLALGNAIAAVVAGVDRVHGTALGLGERCGNPRMDHLLRALEHFGLREAGRDDAYDRYTSLAGTAFGLGDVAGPVPLRHRVVNG